jgi:hypothetical protein
MKLYRSLDHTKYQMDFCVSNPKKGFYDDEIKKLGGKIFLVPLKSKNPIKSFLSIVRIVKEEKLLAKMKDAQQEMVSQLASLTRKLQPGSIRVKNEAIKSDELAELTEQITEQEECVRFLHLILDNQIKSITWDIKNAIEQSKLESM